MQNSGSQSSLPKSGPSFSHLLFADDIYCLPKQITLTTQRLEMCLMNFAIFPGNLLVKLSKEYIFLQMLTEILGSIFFSKC